MREIKFRAWDGIKMLPWESNDYMNVKSMFDWDIFKNDNFKLMQYTGLKDKNGVEIWEGDKWQDEFKFYGKDNYYIVFWCNQDARWKMKSKCGRYIVSLDDHSCLTGEVIGNIHQTELLEEGSV